MSESIDHVNGVLSILCWALAPFFSLFTLVILLHAAGRAVITVGGFSGRLVRQAENGPSGMCRAPPTKRKPSCCSKFGRRSAVAGHYTRALKLNGRVPPAVARS
jgi:hypothetical protein